MYSQLFFHLSMWPSWLRRVSVNLEFVGSYPSASKSEFFFALILLACPDFGPNHTWKIVQTTILSRVFAIVYCRWPQSSNYYYTISPVAEAEEKMKEEYYDKEKEEERSNILDPSNSRLFTFRPRPLAWVVTAYKIWIHSKTMGYPLP